jgi:hypothetical protein
VDHAAYEPDLLSELCRAKTEEGDRFSDGQISDHMIFLMMGARDTTTSALSSGALRCAPVAACLHKSAETAAPEDVRIGTNRLSEGRVAGRAAALVKQGAMPRHAGARGEGGAVSARRCTFRISPAKIFCEGVPKPRPLRSERPFSNQEDPHA